jgi:ubiquinone/menaquinone biosynthesis C-methylase UbiE
MADETIEDQRERHQFHLEIAERIAPTWEKRRAEIGKVSAPVRLWMLRELHPQQGDTLLELAAGVGDTGFEAAETIGGSGRLITSDLSAAMLDAARRRGAELGLGNVDYRVINAEHIPLDDESVDGVLCRFRYMLMPDPAAAFAETRRVLRPGGGWRWPSGERRSATRGSRSPASASASAATSRSHLRHSPRGCSAWRVPGASRASYAKRGSPTRESRRPTGPSRSPTPTTTSA